VEDDDEIPQKLKSGPSKFEGPTHVADMGLSHPILTAQSTQFPAAPAQSKPAPALLCW
jgi:hypothetical protein